MPKCLAGRGYSTLGEFLQAQLARLAVGKYRYGPPSAHQMYLNRAKTELKAYQRSGNREHLLNAANYCWLESVAPQNKKFHWDNKVGSVTRTER